jgi:hypothetical protein
MQQRNTARVCWDASAAYAFLLNLPLSVPFDQIQYLAAGALEGGRFVMLAKLGNYLIRAIANDFQVVNGDFDCAGFLYPLVAFCFPS